MIVMAIDGVLRDPISREAIPSGRVLYRALTEAHGVAVLSDGDTEADTRWLTAHGFRDHNYLAAGDARSAQFSRVRSRGSIDFVVESSPEAAAAALQEGATALFFATPAYTNPSHAPGVRLVPTPWQTLLDEVERQKSVKEGDTRTLNQELL